MPTKYEPLIMSSEEDYKFCAGTLPYAFYNNSMYVLMGKNRRGRLSSFSGKSECNESIIDTASREMFEETCGVVMSLQEIRRCLNYDSLTLQSYTPRGKTCYIVMFQIPYRRWYSQAFIRMQDSMKMVVNELGGDTSKYTEMMDVKWVSIDSLCTNVRRTWECNKMRLAQSEWDKIEHLRQMCMLRRHREEGEEDEIKQGHQSTLQHAIITSKDAPLTRTRSMSEDLGRSKAIA